MLTDNDDVSKLIRELKNAVRRSKTNGAGYVVTVHDARDENRRAFIEVCLQGQLLRHKALERSEK